MLYFQYGIAEIPRSYKFIKLTYNLTYFPTPMKNVAGCLLAICMLCSVVYAQTEITGSVIDANTKEALPGVNIHINHSTVGTTTFADGRFKLTASHPNDSLIVSFIGYTTQVLPAKQANLIIQLKPSQIQLNQIIVSASREGEWIEEAEGWHISWPFRICFAYIT